MASLPFTCVTVNLGVGMGGGNSIPLSETIATAPQIIPCFSLMSPRLK